ncbi:MAG: hypothetical protein ACYT04_84715, partial [Nostoc sp.]
GVLIKLVNIEPVTDIPVTGFFQFSSLTQCEFWDLPLFSNADIAAIAHPSALIWRLACCSQPSKYEGQILFIPFVDCHWRSQVKIKSIDLRAIAGQNKINRLKRAIAGQNKINRL